MTVKYRIGFQIDAETLFGLIAKFLPLDNLSVEEVVERHAPMPRQAKLAPPKKAAKQKRAPRRAGYALNIVDGVNGVIMAALADGEPHRFQALANLVAEAGYARTGIGSKLTRLLEHKFVIREGPGLWRKV